MTRAAVTLLVFSSLTVGGWWASGLGLFAMDLDDTVADLRAGSVRNGRVYVGGGLRGGK